MLIGPARDGAPLGIGVLDLNGADPVVIHAMRLRPKLYPLIGQGFGELGFIAVTGELDCRDADRDGRPGVEFSWLGSDEGDDVSGRGWAALNPDGTLEGHIYFHLGSDSAFRAEQLNGVVR